MRKLIERIRDSARWVIPSSLLSDADTDHSDESHQDCGCNLKPHKLAPDDLAAMYPSTEKERNRIPSSTIYPIQPAAQVQPNVSNVSMASALAHTYPFRIRDPFAKPAPSASEASHTELHPENNPLQMPGLSGSSEGQNGDKLHQSDLYASDEMLALLVPDERIEALWNQIDNLEEQAIMDPSSDQDDIHSNLSKLQDARNYLLAGRRHYEDSEAMLGEVEARLSYKARVRRWSYTWGLVILVYSVLCLVALWAGASRINTLVTPASEIYGIGMQPLLITAIIGSLGGVTGAIYSLWVHVAKKQDFDRQHLMWYLTNPIMGGVLGLFVFLVFHAGISIFSARSELLSNSILLLYTVAWLSGFQQNVAYHLVDRAIKAVLKLGGNAWPRRRRAAHGRT